MKQTTRDSFGLMDDDSGEEYPSSRGTAATQKKETDKTSETPIIDNFGTDLTRLATEGALDPIIGREQEIQRIAQILTRRKKNNPILIGQPGVGK
ncbi:MAG: ATP-dependent Clp protease ATP-binding subunit, partial [Alloprevotella sp.]|nr:ATP-dependent Clp protease ATP-binding subunit [Alloprevotella sp.]